ncbi:MAG: Hsp20/alpha crystallin family protein [Desulfoplanes sp.]|nr:Hsp20/alpha crystallin family protein [Desulfoplanes sp.]MDD4649268.1 Hsp20/alpha crystallin family protein [Desulfoplanes sp.]
MFRNFLPELKKGSLAAKRPLSIADLMEDFWKSPFDFPMTNEAQFPALDISEDEKNITVKAEIPGMEPKDIDISMANGMLIIKGEKKFEDEKKKENYHRIERSYGSFYRSLPLSAGIKEEAIKAQYDKGILTITLPKSEVAKAKKIEITS